MVGFVAFVRLGLGAFLLCFAHVGSREGVTRFFGGAHENEPILLGSVGPDVFWLVVALNAATGLVLALDGGAHFILGEGFYKSTPVRFTLLFLFLIGASYKVLPVLYA